MSEYQNANTIARFVNLCLRMKETIVGYLICIYVLMKFYSKHEAN